MVSEQITVRDITKFLEENAPLWLAEDWDNVGMMVGSKSQSVNKILLCLDVTDEVLEEAIFAKTDMIISHHPIIFKGLKSVTDDNQSEVVFKSIQNNISIYSAHTNLDVADFGVNKSLATKLGLENLKGLNNYKSEKLNKLQNPTLDSISMELKGREYFLGEIGILKKAMTFLEFISHVKSRLKIENLRVCGKIPTTVKKVAVFCGSFDGNLKSILKQKPDVLVTGDIKYHTAIEIIENNICVIDAGHFNTEIVVHETLEKMLIEKFNDLEVLISKKEKDPFLFL